MVKTSIHIKVELREITQDPQAFPSSFVRCFRGVGFRNGQSWVYGSCGLLAHLPATDIFFIHSVGLESNIVLPKCLKCKHFFIQCQNISTCVDCKREVVKNSWVNYLKSGYIKNKIEEILTFKKINDMQDFINLNLNTADVRLW